MGNCLINIEVTGCHHNGRSDDIDQIAADFVQYLKAKGHNVTHATLHAGGMTPLDDITRRMPLREDQIGKTLVDATLTPPSGYGSKV